MSATLSAIKDNNMIFISAQPDEIYFHWQVEIYLYQFSKVGILNHSYAIFGHKGDEPSDYVKWLSEKYKGRIFFFKDERTPEMRNYIPSIRPHILSKFFKKFPNIGKNVFYHDSDIFIVTLPPFETMLGKEDDKKNLGYVSDTISYIGGKYILECCSRYKKAYPQLPDEDLLNKMCEACEISPEIVKKNQENAGGAQYLLKNIGAKFWVDVERRSNRLWKILKEYEAKHPIPHHIQSWTADMWAVLWTYWGRGKDTVVIKSLSFSWGVSSVKEYFSNNIFHLAGVTASMKDTHFYKGAYNAKNVITEYRNNKNLFSKVCPNSATSEYVKMIMEYANKDTGVFVTPNVDRFNLICVQSWAGIYRKVPKKFGGKNMWRSADNMYIIFSCDSGWVLTDKIYEEQITAKSGGHAHNKSEEPYMEGWNIDCKIVRL
jgi:hypothetical protein